MPFASFFHTPEMIVIRHGQTGRAENDRERTLTEEGQRQAKALTKRVSEALKGKSVDIIAVSPTKRTRETARLAFPGREFIEVDELYIPADKAAADRLIKTFEDADGPLLEDLVRSNEEVMDLYSSAAKKALCEIFRAHRGEPAKTMVIIGHDGLLNAAIAHCVYDPHAQDLVAKTQLQEGEFFHIIDGNEIPFAQVYRREE